MSIHILGQHDCVQFGNLKMWAERGLIHIEDTRDGGYEVISVRSSLERMNALNDMLGKSRAELHKTGAFESRVFDDIMKMLEQMIDVCKKAQRQGMPSDAGAKNWLKAARPTTVSVPIDASF